MLPTTARFVVSIVLLLQLAFIHQVKSQTIADIDPAKLKISDYSDTQIMEVLRRYNLDELPPDELANKAGEAGFTQSQIDELISRVEAKNTSGGSVERKNPTPRTKAEAKPRSSGGIFGSEFFSNSNITFEPNLKIATPRYYILGPGDKLLLSIYGNSEVKYNLGSLFYCKSAGYSQGLPG